MSFYVFFEMMYHKVVQSLQQNIRQDYDANIVTKSIKFAECLQKFWPQNSRMLWVLIGVYHTQFSVAYSFLCPHF